MKGGVIAAIQPGSSGGGVALKGSYFQRVDTLYSG